MSGWLERGTQTTIMEVLAVQVRWRQSPWVGGATSLSGLGHGCSFAADGSSWRKVWHDLVGFWLTSNWVSAETAAKLGNPVQNWQECPTTFSEIMTQSRKILCFAGLGVVCLTVAGWFVVANRNVPKTGVEALNRAIELQQAGRYDKAVEVLQTWMKSASRNTSHDGFLYQQIAMICIAKAYKEPAARDESIRQAQLNLEKSLDFINKGHPEENSLDLDGIGGAYEILGDLSETNKCEFYERAEEEFARQLPLIKGDNYTAYGKTVPLEPLRVEVRKHSDGVNEKYSRAGCQKH